MSQPCRNPPTSTFNGPVSSRVSLGDRGVFERNIILSHGDAVPESPHLTHNDNFTTNGTHEVLKRDEESSHISPTSIKHMMNNNSQATLIVDFPARRHRRREDRQVRFASQCQVQPVHSVLGRCSKQELWYSRSDVKAMRLERDTDAYALAQMLRSPTDETLREGIDISQVVGLDKLVDPFLQRRIQETMIRQRSIVVRLQEEVQDEDDLRRISEVYSRASSVRAHTLAKGWVALDAGWGGEKNNVAEEDHNT